MTRAQLEHVIRAAGTIADVVSGSHLSNEADVFPRGHVLAARMA